MCCPVEDFFAGLALVLVAVFAGFCVVPDGMVVAGLPVPTAATLAVAGGFSAGDPGIKPLPEVASLSG